MPGYDGGWIPYVPVAERRRRAARAAEKLRKKGQILTPVTIVGRSIATTFWGKSWCDNMESYRDYESRLPRGRTYVRNGSVLDLKIEPGEVKALVNGSEIYRISISIKEVPAAKWRSLCGDCAGSIDSLVELLQGRFSTDVMERLCRQENGLFPTPSDVGFSCNCPDHALMCKHVAAVLYGVGARLDQKPELLFRLRAVDETDLVARTDTALVMAEKAPATGKVLLTDDVSALFGLDMAQPEAPAVAKPKASGRIPPDRTLRDKRKQRPRKPQPSLGPSSSAKAEDPRLASTQRGEVVDGRPSPRMTRKGRS